MIPFPPIYSKAWLGTGFLHLGSYAGGIQGRDYIHRCPAAADSFFWFLHIGSTLPLVGWPPSECLIIGRYVSVWGCQMLQEKSSCSTVRPQKWNDDLNWREHCSAGWLKHQPVVYVIWWLWRLWCYMLYPLNSTQSLPGQFLHLPSACHLKGIDSTSSWRSPTSADPAGR